MLFWITCDNGLVVQQKIDILKNSVDPIVSRLPIFCKEKFIGYSKLLGIVKILRWTRNSSHFNNRGYRNYTSLQLHFKIVKYWCPAKLPFKKGVHFVIIWVFLLFVLILNSIVRNIVVKNIQDCFVKEMELFMNVFTFEWITPIENINCTINWWNMCNLVIPNYTLVKWRILYFETEFPVYNFVATFRI